MMIGIPRETKPGEQRVALLPRAVRTLTADGHDVFFETQAARAVGVSDDAYRDAGATIVAARDVWDAELVVKVKELRDEDLARAPRGVAVFGFQHLIGAPERARKVAERGATAIAFELVGDHSGGTPILAPMSRIAGRMAIDVAREHLGRLPQRVLVLGAGPAGCAAAEAARAAGSTVTMLRRATATREAVETEALAADLVVGAVFVAGSPTPKLLPRALVARMKRGAMIVDVCIEEGGVAETSRPTTHAQPVFIEEGVIHYCVGNMPAARPKDASQGISEAVLPYVLDMAGAGIEGAIRRDAGLRAGVLVWEGRLVHPALAAEAGLAYTPLTDADLAA
jgi:alanine dehydrogenase